MKTLRMIILASLTLCLSAFTAFAGGDPTGTWKIKAEGPNGRSVDSTLSLQWENNQLTGSIDNRAGKAKIVNAQFTDDRVSFSVVRKIRRRSITVNYTAKLQDDTLKGTLQTKGRSDQLVTVPWAAERSK